jgi:S-adenosylmethionine hydrolase
MSPDELVVLELPRPRQEDGALVAHVTVVDGYGNVQLDAAPGDLGGRLGRAVEVGAGRPARYLRTFADAEAGELLLYEDAAGMLALAVNGGEAVSELGGLSPGDEVRLAAS